ncbi:MAG: hypothetical protein MJ175_08340 [Clostridia bacterium]|nr:hypothetical protein [Clostridia bacterium]
MQKGQPVLRIAMKASSVNMDPIQKHLSQKGGIVCFSDDGDPDEVTITVTQSGGGNGI